jgi:SpoIID/LytB domain protein
MPSSWPAEALKVQAIAARTYAAEKVSRLGENRPVCNCGMYASTLDQAYVGAQQEVTNWVNAVNATKGQGVTYQGKLVQAYYSASDGGFSENNENVWGGSPLPYLRGVCDPGDYDGGANPHANWAVPMNGQDVGTALARGGYNVGTVSQVAILPPRGVSGRVRPIIDSTHGGWSVTGTTASARISAGTFQSLLGLQSTMDVYNISGAIRTKYDSMNCLPGQPNGQSYTWRYLNGTIAGSAQDFPTSRLFMNASTKKVYWVWGVILTRYDAERRNGDDLGLPTGDQYGISGGYRANFEHGYITSNTSAGTTHVQKTS